MKTLIHILILLTFSTTLDFSSTALARPGFGKHGLVTSTSDLASRAGVDAMKRGGNAIDGAVATAFVLAVTKPYYASIGGGGFMLVRFKNQITALDHRERAPLKATRDMFLKTSKKDASEIGGLAIATPGNVMGLYETHKKYGKLPWKSLLIPAITIAEMGFQVTEEFARITNSNAKDFNDAGKKYFSIKGKPLEVGQTFKQPQLANALRHVQLKGAEGFYKGPVAEDLIATVKKLGGVLEKKDLDSYATRQLKPVHAKVFGADVYSMPPPSSGGTLLLAELKMAENLKLPETAKPYSQNEYHALSEIMARAFFDRQYIADPKVMLIDPKEIFKDERVQKWAASINRDKKTAIDVKAFEISLPKAPLIPPAESPNTTHYSVVDSEGNAVAATTTVNGEYGSGVFTEKFGINLNNEMDDFTTKPGEANMFGLTQSALNEVAPLKTPLSSMTPTIVEKDGKLFMSVGSPGGPRIINAVFQVLYHALTTSFNIDEIVQAPRVHHQYSPDKLFYDRVLTPDIVDGLAKRGHIMSEGNIAKVYGIRVTPEGLLEGAFDWRGEGGAAGF